MLQDVFKKGNVRQLFDLMHLKLIICNNNEHFHTADNSESSLKVEDFNGMFKILEAGKIMHRPVHPFWGWIEPVVDG